MVSSLKVLRSAVVFSTFSTTRVRAWIAMGCTLLLGLPLAEDFTPSAWSGGVGPHALVGASTQSTATTRRLARAALSSGIRSYRDGFHKRARFYLIIAERHDRTWLDRRPEAHKLRALLYLSEDRPARAADSLVRSVRIKADPFLFYLLGNYNLRLRAYKQARASYRAAVLSARDLSEKAGKQLVDARLTVIKSELPFACPVGTPAADRKWVDDARQKPFSMFERSEDLWTRGLHPLEYAAAAYQALALNRHLRRKRGPVTPATRDTADDDLLLSELRRRDVSRGPEPGMAEFMAGRERDGSYRTCIRRLEAQERREKELVARGSTDPSVHRLKIIGEALRRMHRLRVSWFGDARAWFSFASFLRRSGRGIEALHAFRKALELTPLELRRASLKGNLRERVQIYRLLAATYRELGREHDAESAAVFAHELENYQNNSLDFETGRIRNGKAGALLIMKLLRRGRLYTWNREGLLLLIDHARNTGDPRLENYRRRLAERDKRFDEAELFSALRDYR